MTTIDWNAIGQGLLGISLCLGGLFVLILLAALNDLWLQHTMTPEEYERMLDSYEDFWP